jgi:protocatechuate 3,4-dioxygenase beta subunit
MKIPLCIGVLWFEASLAAQSPPSQNAVTPTAEACSVQGTVMDAETGQPLPRVPVRAGSLTALTNAAGHYELTGITPGIHRVYTGEKEGYIGKARSVRLLAGQNLAGVDVKLDREAILAGRVLDRDKKPVVGAHVSVRRQGYRNGQPAVLGFRGTTTNDLGEFRFAGLWPGKFYLEASPAAQRIRPKTSQAAEQDETVFANVTTFYSASPSLESATPVSLRAGERREGIDLLLLNRPTVCVTSGLANGVADLPTNWAVTLSEDTPGTPSALAVGVLSTGDEFRICKVGQGRYRLWAFSVGTKDGVGYASEVFSVGEKPLNLPRLAPSAAQAIRGRMIIANSRPEDRVPAGLSVNLRVKDRLQIAGEALAGSVDQAGAFVIPAAFPHDYWLEVNGLPQGFYVKQVSVGGTDATGGQIHVGAVDLNIVLSSDAPSVTGRVTGEDSLPVADATVLIVEATAPAGWAPTRVLATTTDQTGLFTFGSVPPGKYRIAAFPDLDFDRREDPEFLRSYLGNSSEELVLSAGERKQISLKPSPHPGPQ